MIKIIFNHKTNIFIVQFKIMKYNIQKYINLIINMSQFILIKYRIRLK